MRDAPVVPPLERRGDAAERGSPAFVEVGFGSHDRDRSVFDELAEFCLRAVFDRVEYVLVDRARAALVDVRPFPKPPLIGQRPVQRLGQLRELELVRHAGPVDEHDGVLAVRIDAFHLGLWEEDRGVVEVEHVGAEHGELAVDADATHVRGQALALVPG